MPARYRDTYFNILAEEKDGTLAIPLLVPSEWGVVRTRIPYANMEQVQFTGSGNSKFEFKCEVYDEASYLALRAMVADGLGGTLQGLGDDILYGNMYLVDMKDVWKVTFAVEYHFTLTFEWFEWLPG